MPIPEQVAERTTEPVAGVTTGITGQTWRATITPWGDIEPWGNVRPAVRWYVAADDRWHVPAEEPAVRQRRVDGTPVVETRLRVPDGDAVQRIWSVADLGGLTVVEIENDSSRPFAVAITGGGVLTERLPADVAIQGIELPPDAIVVPVGHRTTVRVGVAHETAGGGRLVADRLASSAAVVRGWTTVCDRASRLFLPDATIIEAVIAARCDLLLEGPVDADSDPLGFLSDVAQLGRLGDNADQWLPDIIGPVARVARNPDLLVDDVLDGLERLALMVLDDRAANDISTVRARRARDGIGRSRHLIEEQGARPSALERRSLGAFVDSVERSLASGGDLLCAGFPPTWPGSNFEVHGLPTSPRSTLSFAVRWHGDRPAVLWEQSGEPVTLTARSIDPDWRTTQVQGETLWPALARASYEATAETGVTGPNGPTGPGLLPPDESFSFG